MGHREHRGRDLVIAALRGEATETVPVGVLTWGYDYLWRVAGLAPWQLACGSTDTWHRTLLALLERHQPDILWFLRTGSGSEDPTLLDEDARRWVVRDNNTGRTHALLKDSLTMVDPETGASRRPAALGEMHSQDDVDAVIPTDGGLAELYRAQLVRLIEEVGDRALVMPCTSPAYIRACYAFGFERSMEAMLFEPELFTYACERYRMQEEQHMRELAESSVQAVYVADGWASCDVISPAMFERFALPYQATITEAIYQAGMQIVLWNEGNILPILDQEATLQVDAFHFEQPRKGVDLTVERVREAFGPARCLFGNIDSEGLLIQGDPEGIRDVVGDQLRQSGRGAPFVLCTGSPLPSNVAPEAVDVMIDAARAFRW